MTRRSPHEGASASAAAKRTNTRKHTGRGERAADTSAAFEQWRRAQQLEQQARPPSFFDVLAGVAEVPETTTESAIESVTSHAGSEFVDHVVGLVEQVALRQEFLTIDDVAPRVTVEVYDRRALGGAMRVAARRKLIEGTGTYRPSARAERHHSPVALWRSLVFREAA